MKLSDILKQFKTIEPDQNFAERSRREILMSPQTGRFTARGMLAIFHALEAGAAVALAGLFILILTNSLSGTASIAPIQYSVIDPAGLHAEADAIDMQIQLTDLTYPQTTSSAMTASTASASEGLAPALSKMLAAETSTPSSDNNSATPSSSPTSTPSSTLSIDQALQELTQ